MLTSCCMFLLFLFADSDSQDSDKRAMRYSVQYVTVSTDDDDVIVWSVCPTYRNRLTLRAVVLAGIDE